MATEENLKAQGLWDYPNNRPAIRASHPMTDNTQSDVVEDIVSDACAAEPPRGVHEGGEYYAERIVRRAIEQGTLTLTALRSDRDAVVDEERAAIVAWLEAAADERGKKTQDGWALHWAADRIAGKEHLATPTGEPT